MATVDRGVLRGLPEGVQRALFPFQAEGVSVCPPAGNVCGGGGWEGSWVHYLHLPPFLNNSQSPFLIDHHLFGTKFFGSPLNMLHCVTGILFGLSCGARVLFGDDLACAVCLLPKGIFH